MREGAGALTERLKGRLPVPLLAPGSLPVAFGGFALDSVAQEATQRRLFPWIAVAFAAGILVFFTATDGQPSLAAPLAVGGLAAAAAVALRHRPLALAVAIALAAFHLGFAAGVLRVATVAAPVLPRTMIGPLTGFVEALEEREEGARAVVLVESLGTLTPEARPQRVRVSYKGLKVAGGGRVRPDIRPGDFLAATARLLPPPEPARPGGYDFARDAFFRGIGAVGSLVGTIEVRPPPRPPPWDLRLAAGIDDARNALTRRMATAGGGQAGAVAAALVTGKRGLIDQASNDALRAAGIYHVVSISGLHMVLAAGVVFWLVRAGLALVPGAALTLPIKKWAAGLAMLGVTAYCAFSGWDIAAERSLIMTLTMLGAILVDRPALSMRNLALAAIIALAREPEGLLGPSFQMSFGAVAGLIAFSRFLSGRLWSDAGAGPVGRAVSFAAAAVLGSLATTVVATLATAPFSAYHFQNLQPFGLIGNLLTLPLISFVVMPSAVLGLLAYPFALDAPVWWVMGLAVEGMLAISRWIAGFHHAIVVVPAFGPLPLGLLSLALLVATLCVSRLRRLALVPAALGLAFAASPERPDLYVDREGGGAALRGRDGRLVVLGRAPPFVLEQWLKADGDARDRADPALGEGATCDRLGCVATGPGGTLVALSKDKRALAEDCARAAIVITRATAPPGCAAALVLDRAHLAAHGSTTVRMRPDGSLAITVARRPDTAVPWRPSALPAPAPPPIPPRALEPTRSPPAVPDEPAIEPDAGGDRDAAANE